MTGDGRGMGGGCSRHHSAGKLEGGEGWDWDGRGTGNGLRVWAPVGYISRKPREEDTFQLVLRRVRVGEFWVSRLKLFYLDF